MTEAQDNQNTQAQGQSNIGAVPSQGQNYAPQSPATTRPQIPDTRQQGQGGAEQLRQDHPQTQAPAPQPVDLNLLAKQKEFVFTDKNGHKWNYTFQFPGMKKVLSIYDEARLPNGGFDRNTLYESFFQYVIVAPTGLNVDAFDNRPGLFELMDAAESFLNEA